MTGLRGRVQSEKTDDIPLEDLDDHEVRAEAQDIIAPLSPMRSAHRRASLGIFTWFYFLT
jgi:hypothetical protein